MKKSILIITLFFLVVVSCKDNSYREKEYLVTDFKKSILDTISPIKGETYVSKYIKVSGNMDDSVYVKFNGSFKFYLKGKIDTIISGDYYGEKEVEFEFNPYKANKGKLKVTFGI